MARVRRMFFYILSPPTCALCWFIQHGSATPAHHFAHPTAAPSGRAVSDSRREEDDIYLFVSPSPIARGAEPTLDLPASASDTIQHRTPIPYLNSDHRGGLTPIRVQLLDPASATSVRASTLQPGNATPAYIHTFPTAASWG